MSADRDMQRIQHARRFARIVSDYIDINIILISAAQLTFLAMVLVFQFQVALRFVEGDVEIIGATLLSTIAGLLSLKALFYRRKNLQPEWSDSNYALSMKYSLSALMMVIAGLLVLAIVALL